MSDRKDTAVPQPVDCPFCAIARHELDAVVLYEDDTVMAFLDRSPIRPGHTQVITKAHFATFDVLPPELAAQILHLGQRLARRMKKAYRVERVAFLFTGADVAHAHAHVVPMHETMDITSARYLVTPDELTWSSEHLYMDKFALERVQRELGFNMAENRVFPATSDAVTE